jgi:hypothetical protein
MVFVGYDGEGWDLTPRIASSCGPEGLTLFCVEAGVRNMELYISLAPTQMFYKLKFYYESTVGALYVVFACALFLHLSSVSYPFLLQITIFATIRFTSRRSI